MIFASLMSSHIRTIIRTALSSEMLKVYFLDSPNWGGREWVKRFIIAI